MSTTTAKVSSGDSTSAEPFHIVYDQRTNDPVMWFGICVDEAQMSQFLRNNVALNPYFLVVVTTPEGYEVERHIAPLTQGIVHHAFRRAGEFKVMATVVYEPEGDTSKLRRLFNYRNSYQRHACDVVDIDGNLHENFEWFMDGKSDTKHHHQVKRHPYVSETTVVVHPNNFAKERAAWRKALVNTFFAKKGENECSWRKRWITSLALCVFWLPLQYLMKIVGLILYGVTGFVYGLDMKMFLPPGRRGSIFDMFGDVNKHNWWLFKRGTRYGYCYRNPLWNLGFISTIAWVMASLAISAEPKTSLVTAAIVAAKWIGTFLLLIMFFVFLINGIDWLAERRKGTDYMAKKHAKKEAKLKLLKAKQGDVEQQLSSMSCSASGQPITIDHLLERRKTSRVVIWNRTKDLVCQPFQEH